MPLALVVVDSSEEWRIRSLSDLCAHALAARRASRACSGDCQIVDSGRLPPGEAMPTLTLRVQSSVESSIKQAQTNKKKKNIGRLVGWLITRSFSFTHVHCTRTLSVASYSLVVAAVRTGPRPYCDVAAESFRARGRLPYWLLAIGTSLVLLVLSIVEWSLVRLSRAKKMTTPAMMRQPTAPATAPRMTPMPIGSPATTPVVETAAEAADAAVEAAVCSGEDGELVETTPVVESLVIDDVESLVVDGTGGRVGGSVGVGVGAGVGAGVGGVGAGDGVGPATHEI